MNQNVQEGAKKKGFPCLTIALVMIIPGIAFLGILAAIAVPAFMNYVKRSKATEMTMLVPAISYKVVDACNENKTAGQPLFPPAAASSTTPPSSKKQAADWSGFESIGYSGDAMTYGRYSMGPVGSGYVVMAEGDLDADGQTSKFSIQIDDQCVPTPLDVSNELE